MPQQLWVFEPRDMFATMADDGFARVWVIDPDGMPRDPYAPPGATPIVVDRRGDATTTVTDVSVT
jgi:hypothetical protein